MKLVDVVVERVLMSDYFEALGLAKSCVLNVSELEANYLSLQNKFHPDRFVLAQEKELASKNIQLINNAYKVLLNPVSRCTYIAESNGIVLENYSSPEILEEAMELRMEIESLSPSDAEKFAEDALNKSLLHVEVALATGNEKGFAEGVLKLRYIEGAIKGIKRRVD